VASLSNHLPDDAVVYVHTEQLIDHCAACWRNGDLEHDTHAAEHNELVRGKISAPPHVTPPSLLAALDAALAATPDVSLFAPELCASAGLSARSRLELTRLQALERA